MESCDDGNFKYNDGCSSTCLIEAGWDCWHTTGGLSSCKKIDCGDNFMEGSEACDDANPDDLDGCSSTCTLEAGWTCTGGSFTSITACTSDCNDS